MCTIPLKLPARLDELKGRFNAWVLPDCGGVVVVEPCVQGCPPQQVTNSHGGKCGRRKRRCKGKEILSYLLGPQLLLIAEMCKDNILL